MRRSIWFGSLFLIVGLLANRSSVFAQMVTTQTPFQTMGSTFTEQNGIDWSVRGPNFFANFGGGAGVPFGNAGLNAPLNGGIGFGGGGISGGLRFNFSQGSSRSISSSSPSLTTMNGYPGTFTNQVIRPFVTGVTPIVGGYPATSASQQMSDAFQARQAAQLRAQSMKANTARQQKALTQFQRGLRAEEDGDLKKARANYRLALGVATGPLRTEIIGRMRANEW